MIEFVQVEKRHGAQILLERESFRLLPGERAGFVGPNGAGKSTLFDLAAGDAEPDSGRIDRARDLRIGYLRQHPTPSADAVPLVEFVEKAAPSLEEIRRETAALERQLDDPASAAFHDAILRRLGDLQAQFEDAGGYSLRAKAATTLAGLGFREADLARRLGDFSGGWRMRAELARALVADPDLLLLDEPSNYLDVPAVEWLRRRLDEFRGTLAMISHDRYLLESLCQITFEVAGGHVTRYPGRYSWYAAEREKRRALLLARAANDQRRRDQLERFVERFRSKNSLATRVQSKIKLLERMERVAAPELPKGRGSIRLPAPSRCGEQVLRCDGLGFRYAPDAPWIFRNVDWSLSRGAKVAVIGPNGAGKTTLLRVLAGDLTPVEGSCALGHRVEPGWQSQDTTAGLPPLLDLLSVLKQAAPDTPEGELRSLLGGFGFSGGDVEKRVEVLSGGERVRLAFARLLVHPPNLLLLDEPTTHLDVEAREALQDAISAYEGTVVLVSHDIAFIRAVATEILDVHPDGAGVRHFTGSYDDYRERLAREAAGIAAPPPPAPGAPAPKSEAPAPEITAGAARQADRKQRLAALRRLERELAAVEDKIADAEAEQTRLHEALAAPDATPEARADAGRRLKALETALADLYADWERLGLSRDSLAAGS